MKLKFKHQDFQTTAVNAVCDLFLGQEKNQATFSVVDDAQMNMVQNEYGIGNALHLDSATLLANMHRVQRQNKQAITQDLENNRFCIEMETGTGKTFVYTKSIFELNKRYGFTKFIIVVPSVAIREGVYKSLQITSDYFGNQYSNVPCRYFIYNSAKLSDVRQFATSNNIEIMIINIDAFKKAENIINQAHDKLGGESAIRYIQDTNPVVIIDEPQSVDNTPKAKEAIASLNPLCVLRYSATHREKINILYRLTPVDAYQGGLVKQIVVSSNQVANDFNKPYIRLVSVSQEGGFKAKIEIHASAKDGTVSPKIVPLKQGEDLFIKSGKRDLYEGYQLSGIDCTPGQERIEFGNTEVVELGKTIGGVDEMVMKRAQIRRTIEAHFQKELRYHALGIKVLSLFFIDEVKRYRSTDGEKGVYAQMFEECYGELLALPKYALLAQRFGTSTTGVHDGYFSQDKKGTFKDTKGDTIADYDTYSTIMKDKEWLLSFDCPLRFIWSHSALKEGWDNPNVFQVCTLIEQKSVFTCRQKIGRGLRLCVNQEGDRIEDKNINVLHVMANESFSEFAEKLQRELEDDTGIKFGVLQLDLFQGITYEEVIVNEKQVDEQDAKLVVEYMVNHGYVTEDLRPTAQTHQIVTQDIQSLPKQMQTAVSGIVKAVEQGTAVQVEDIIGTSYTETITIEKEVTYEDAAELMDHFQKQDYITKAGKVKDAMKSALAEGTLDLPKKFEAARSRFEGIITHANRTVPLRDASREVTVRLNKQMMISPEFQELWNRIKQKTTYRVTIDTDKLVADCVGSLRDMPAIPRARLVTESAKLEVEHAGVTSFGPTIQTMELEDSYTALPHIINIISEDTLTKRDTVRRILMESGRVTDFLHNPQAFLERALDIIRRNRHKQAIDKISYIKLAGEEYYAMQIFNTEELVANLDKNAVAVANSVYDYVIYDSSTVERPFAVALDNDPDVKLFFKIPSKFKIETPIGTYNPDWAVYLDRDGIEKLYFVIETKGTSVLDDLRTKEQLKIKCGIEHFKALESNTDFRVARSWNEIKSQV